MSTSRNKRNKAARRVLDACNPERKRIRQLIRDGEIPKYKIEVVTTGQGKRRKSKFKLVSTFNLLTAPEPTKTEEKTSNEQQ